MIPCEGEPAAEPPPDEVRRSAPPVGVRIGTP